MLLDLRIVAILAALFVGQSCAQWRGNQINTTICTWEQLRVNIIQDTVYLDGGSQWWKLGFASGDVSPDNTDNFAGILWTLDLSSSFDTATDNLTALFGSFSKTGGGAANNLAPNHRDGVMFANDYMFWLYGGLPRASDAFQLPHGDQILGYERDQYGPHLNLWEPGFVNTFPDITEYVTNGAGVSAPSENLGFYVAGMHAPRWGPIYDNQSATVASDQMIKVDMSEMRASKWTNTSLPSYVPSRANAEAVWVPVSESGAVVLIGGVVNPVAIWSSSGLTQNQQNASEEQSPEFMRTVSVYDVASDEWYIQETSGDIPPALTEFCSVYASAADGSSHNIYIYGGYDGISPLHQPVDDVYVLSLPSFEWIKLYSGTSAHARKGHRCVKPYPDQMLVFGGIQVDTLDCLEMIQVFNLNTGRFQDTYNPTEWSEYRVPDLVSGRIGGGPTGGATKAKPDSWTNSSLADLFTTTYTKTIATYYPYNATSSTPTPTPVSSGSSHGSSFPAWAGAIIGVLLGLLLIASIFIFWLLRRRRKYPKSRRTSEVSGTRFRVMQWMYSGASAGEGGAKENETTVSAGYTNDTAVEHSVVAPTDAPTDAPTETQGEPVYEMHDPSTAPPIELPTPFNDNGLPSPSTIAPSPGPGYGSPVSPDAPTAINENRLSASSPMPMRPVHHRNVSSVSSEDSQVAQRPRYLSGMSDVSVSSRGTRIVELENNGRGLGLEDIQDTEGLGDGSRRAL